MKKKKTDLIIDASSLCSTPRPSVDSLFQDSTKKKPDVSKLLPILEMYIYIFLVKHAGPGYLKKDAFNLCVRVWNRERS